MRVKDEPTFQTTRADLMERVWTEPLTVVAAQVGLSANGLAKLCDRLMIPRPQRRYWSRPPEERAARRPALPPPPPGVSEAVSVGSTPQVRRDRTRLTLAERQKQLMDCAAAIVASEGVSEVSIKRVAREVGISEAQAHNCFSRRIDLLVALARRQLAEMETTRTGIKGRGRDVLTRTILSTVAYLHEAAARGPVLQSLLNVPEVRDAMREERVSVRDEVRKPILDTLVDRYGITRQRALGSNAILTAVCLRAGALVAANRTDLLTAERFCIPIVVAGSRSNSRAPRAGEAPGG